ncbi:MAG: hypothetical protein R3D51_15080 [Hyphomicrobiaceae bacterium]
MSSASLAVVAKAMILAAAGYYLGLILVGANVGAKYAREEALNEPDLPRKMVWAAAALTWFLHLLSGAIVVLFICFAVWWLDVSSWGDIWQ